MADTVDDLVRATVDLDDRVKILEERIRQLEARPYPIVQPYPVPTWPHPSTYPPPWEGLVPYPYPVWYSSDRTA